MILSDYGADPAFVLRIEPLRVSTKGFNRG